MPPLILMRKKGHEPTRVAPQSVEGLKRNGWHVDGMVNALPVEISSSANPEAPEPDPSGPSPNTVQEMREIVERRMKDPKVPRSTLLGCLERLVVKVPAKASHDELLDLLDAKLQELGA